MTLCILHHACFSELSSLVSVNMGTVTSWIDKSGLLISSPRTEDYTLLASASNSALMSCCCHLAVYHLSLLVDYKMCLELIWRIFNL